MFFTVILLAAGESSRMGNHRDMTTGMTNGVVEWLKRWVMPGERVAKVTVSLPRPLLEFADRLAQETAKSRSEVIAALLAKEEEAQIQALMEEGYREMAEENRRFAKEVQPTATEMIMRIPWDEPSDG